MKSDPGRGDLRLMAGFIILAGLGVGYLGGAPLGRADEGALLGFAVAITLGIIGSLVWEFRRGAAASSLTNLVMVEA